MAPFVDAMSKIERRGSIFKLHPPGKLAVQLLHVNLGELDEPLLGFPVRRQGVRFYSENSQPFEKILPVRRREPSDRPRAK